VIWRFLTKRHAEPWDTTTSARRGSYSLQVVLWVLWTGAIVALGYFFWHADHVAQRPVNTLGLVIHCTVAGLIGLVVMTVIEMRLEPWRFVD